MFISKSIHLVRYSGLWIRDKKKLQYVLSRFSVFCYLSTYALQVVDLITSKDDIQRLFECFSVISFSGMGILKLYSLSTKTERWSSLLDKLITLEMGKLPNQNFLSVTEYDSDQEESSSVCTDQLMRTYEEKFSKTSSWLFRIYFFTGFIFILSPFIEYAFWLTLGKEVNYPHILPSWNPLDNVHFAFYAVAVIFEGIASVYCILVHMAFDTAVIGSMIFICGQFCLLVHRSELIAGRGENYIISRKRDIRAHYRIIKCHRIHILLVRSIEELDELLRGILGVYFFLATLTLCSVAVRLKTEELSSVQLATLLQYMCGCLVQLFLYCSFGDNVYNESAITSGQGPFAAAIWCISPHIRRELTLLGIGMMKPRRLHAGPIHSVDLPSFIQIVRAAYSYYAVVGSKN